VCVWWMGVYLRGERGRVFVGCEWVDWGETADEEEEEEGRSIRPNPQQDTQPHTGTLAKSRADRTSKRSVMGLWRTNCLWPTSFVLGAMVEAACSITPTSIAAVPDAAITARLLSY